MKRLFESMLIACFFLTTKTNAQNEIDALRFSMINYGSTARSLSMGNAFGALGADLSVMATNPAGIALYRRSEFSFSPTFILKNTDSELLGATSSASRFNFNFGNFGAVWNFDLKDESKALKSWSFGIGYNRLNDFSNNYLAKGLNKNNSLLDSYAEQANGIGPSSLPYVYPFDVDLAYQSYLINTTTDTLSYISVIPNGDVAQQRTVETRGGQGEWDFSFGTNYNNQLYFGVTLGLTTLNYQEDMIWTESDYNNQIISTDSIYNFQYFTYTQSLRTRGTGINGKFGVIYRPADFVRFGLAIHTPTSYTLSDEFATNIRSVVTVNDSTAGSAYREWYSPIFIPFNYRLATPFHAIGSMAFIIGKQALISAEYEFTDYSMASFKEKDPAVQFSYSDVNTTIKQRYGASHTFRFGGEYRYDIMRFRLGGSYSTSPFSSNIITDSKTDQSQYSVTGGMGFRNKNVYIDVAYAYTHKGSFYSQYSLNNVAQAGISESLSNNRLMFTIGFNY